MTGQIVLFGGKIITTQNHQAGTTLTVLQLPLDDRDRPRHHDRSQGRFLVATDQFLDPAIYAKGSLVTVVGELVATETHLIGEMAYRYPKIKAQEIKLWQPHDTIEPRIRFGIGVGATF